VAIAVGVLVRIAASVAVGATTLAFLATGIAAAADTGPPITEVVPVRPNDHDSHWPPVLAFAVVVVVIGGLVVAVRFLRTARASIREGHPRSRE